MRDDTFFVTSTASRAALQFEDGSLGIFLSTT
jgi:hypothetical protein